MKESAFATLSSKNHAPCTAHMKDDMTWNLSALGISYVDQLSTK